MKKVVLRVLRGGSADYDPRDLRTIIIGIIEPEYRYGDIGFRLVVVRRKP